jgi:hypothetical protein
MEVIKGREGLQWNFKGGQSCSDEAPDIKRWSGAMSRRFQGGCRGNLAVDDLGLGSGGVVIAD